MNKYKQLSEHKNLEIEWSRFDCDSFSTWIGVLLTISNRMVFLSLGLLLFKFEFRINWGGDHKGLNFMFETSSGHFFDIHFYDDRHEEDDEN